MMATVPDIRLQRPATTVAAITTLPIVVDSDPGVVKTTLAHTISKGNAGDDVNARRSVVDALRLVASDQKKALAHFDDFVALHGGSRAQGDCTARAVERDSQRGSRESMLGEARRHVRVVMLDAFQTHAFLSESPLGRKISRVEIISNNLWLDFQDSLEMVNCFFEKVVAR